MTLPTEPLDQLSDLAWRIAPETCKPEHDCRAYHRTWPMIRRLLKDGVRPAGENAIAPRLAQFDTETPARIFVSGGADTGVLALAAHATAEFQQAPEFFFLDRCETTIRENTEYAKQANLSLTTQTADLTDCRFRDIDAILAHTFLVFFPRDIRPLVIKTWFDALRPGGIVISSSTIGSRPSRQVGTLSDDETSANIAKLDQAAQDAGFDADMRAELAKEAQEFWQVKRTHEHQTEDELQTLFQDAGFVIDEMVKQPRKHGEGPRDRPGDQGERYRLFVVARKPE